MTTKNGTNLSRRSLLFSSTIPLLTISGSSHGSVLKSRPLTTIQYRDEFIQRVTAGISQSDVVPFGDIGTLWITDIASAIATLYVGYQLGSKIDDVGTALAYTIRAVGDLAESMSRVIDRIADVIDAINKAIEAIGRKIDASFMTDHMSRIKSASIAISDILYRLDKVDPKDNHLKNPYVLSLSDDLKTELRELYYSINQYSAHDGNPPSVATIVGCSPAIGLWAQTYTYLERYKTTSQRVGIWDTNAHLNFRKQYDDIFSYISTSISSFEKRLAEDLLVPTLNHTVVYRSGKFLESNIKYQEHYGNDPTYDKLFARRNGYPFDFFVTEPAGSASPIPIPTRGYEWMFARQGGVGSSNPSQVAEAYKWQSEASLQRAPLTRFINEYTPLLAERTKTLAIFDRPVGW